MSYGTEVPQLDFEHFHTACLSGDNGQGKSALLDAITWALWGKARKATGQINPAPDLLRVGADEMRVEFVFDLDGNRYRVIRTYLGIRRRTFLELHVLGTGNRQYLPLSATSHSKTQHKISNVIGLDYDTFINSALLLQGRSDEFANRTPGERKEILARILNLGRYEELRRLASERVKEKTMEAQRAVAEAERLRLLVQPMPGWKKQEEELRSRIERKEAALATARSQEVELIELMARYESLRDQADRFSSELILTNERLKEYETDAESIQASINDANALIARAGDIGRNHSRMLALQKERQQLDDLGQIHLGYERERERRRRELTEHRHKAEMRLKELASQRNVARHDLDEVIRAEQELPRIRRRQKAVNLAARREVEMRRERARIEQLRHKARTARNSIDNQRSVLQSRIADARKQQKQQARRLRAAETLAEERQALQGKVARREECLEVRESTRVEGNRVAGEFEAVQGRKATREEQRMKARRQLDFLDTETDGQCPTCGTDLTASHRTRVHAMLQAEVGRLLTLIQRDDQLLRQLTLRRQLLRERWMTQNAEVVAIERAQVDLASVMERLTQLEQYRKAHEETAEVLERLQRQRDEQTFAQKARRTLDLLTQEIAKATFDEKEFEQVRHEAAQAQRYSDLMDGITRRIARKELLQREIVRSEEAERTLRRQLDDGSLFGNLQVEIRRLDAQLQQVGYDPARLHAVRQELVSLNSAGEEMARLTTALQESEKLKNRLDATRKRLRKETRERDKKAEKIRQIHDAMVGMRDTEVQLLQARKKRRQLEAGAKALQVQLGEINEKLAMAKVHSRQMKQCHRARVRHETDAKQYGHLARAFGKHGIPSLIIEETLPEITQRASSILERLSDGQMEVRIDTLREKKSTDGTIDTLDIKVKGEQGTFRAYETFSGGEAFRVNFALRIALAKLLADRHGIQMRMMVIDEGFGTQDQRGLEYLLQAIAEVRNEFDKILVITHLPEVKDIFPVRIEVKKDPVAGSGFQIYGV